MKERTEREGWKEERKEGGRGGKDEKKGTEALGCFRQLQYVVWPIREERDQAWGQGHADGGTSLDSNAKVGHVHRATLGA